MAIRRYPFDLFEEMEQLMDGMRRSMYSGMNDVRSMSWMPDVHMNLDTNEEGYVFVADLPGFEKEEINLRFDDGHLIVEATHEVDKESAVGTTTRSREVRESVLIPTAIVEDEIEATYRNGVLEVHLPTEETVDSVDDDAHRIDID